MRRPTRREVDEAIATVADSRSTHVNWRDKLKAGMEEPHPSIGDVAWHQACIDGYDQVLDVLRRARP